MLSVIELALKYWKAIAIAGAVLIVWGWHSGKVSEARRIGYQSAISDINAKAAQLDKQAAAAAQSVDECFAKGDGFTWNRSAGKCVKQ
jgi:hypothetical protein